MNRFRVAVRASVVLACLALPSLAHAQASLAGTVQDASGAILPGVTVEITSPALIEKVRSAVTDGSGQYRITEVRPGTYAMTFTLPGFVVVRREGVVVSGIATITIDAEMRVGGVQETITVTGETPVVDVQSTRRQAVLDNETVNTAAGVARLRQPADGGAGRAGEPAELGDRSDDAVLHVERRPQQRGPRADRRPERRLGVQRRRRLELRLRHRQRGRNPDHRLRRARRSRHRRPGVEHHPAHGRQPLPRHGVLQQRRRVVAGQQPRRPAARAPASRRTPALIKSWDASFSIGGPILRDRLWFFGTSRTFGNHTDNAGLYGNLNAGDASNVVVGAGPGDEVAQRQRQEGRRPSG